MKNIASLKQQYIDYYAEVPVQRYAAMYIGRDEDTIIRWKKTDTNFADALQRAKAEWIRRKVMKVEAKFALEKLEKQIFGSQIAIENATSTLQNSKDSELAEKFTQFLKQETLQ